jgi:hypothetical protein
LGMFGHLSIDMISLLMIAGLFLIAASTGAD